MGVESYLLTSTINGVAAQRLVRKLCPHCRVAYRLDPAEALELGIQPDEAEFWRCTWDAEGRNPQARCC